MLLFVASAFAQGADQASEKARGVELTVSIDPKDHAIHLQEGQEILVAVGKDTHPALLCFGGTEFDASQIFSETVFELSGDPFLPKIFPASEDDVHGFVDDMIKTHFSNETSTDLVARIEHRAFHGTEMFPSLFDLLTDCPPVWDPYVTICNQSFSPFGKSCIAISSGRKADVKVKVFTNSQDLSPILFGVGLLLIFTAIWVSEIALLWYLSGISLTVLLGLIILIVFILRRTGSAASHLP